MSPVLSLTTIFLQKNCDFLPLWRCANSDYQFNHKCHKRATRGLSSLPALSLQYYKWTQVEKKYGACSFDVDFFISSKSCPFLFSYMPPTWNQHRLKWLKNCQSCTVYLKMKQKQNSIFINVFLPFANSISGLSVSRFFVHSIYKTHLIFDEKSYYK